MTVRLAPARADLDMTFSIITVCLNAGRELDKTVRSVLAQTRPDYELIVKDGMSTDGSVEALSPSPRLRIMRRQDCGIFDAMNQALAECAGEYVLFLNAGDRLATPNVLQEIRAQTPPGSSRALVYGNYYNDEFGCIVKSPSRLSKSLFFRNMLCHQACFVARSVFTSLGGFDTSFSLLADYEMLARILIKHSLPYKSTGVVVSSYRGGGVTRREESRHVIRHEMRRIRERYFGRWERLRYHAVYALTLPGLRNFVMASPRCRRVWPLYTRLVNGYNQLLHSRRDGPGGGAQT